MTTQTALATPPPANTRKRKPRNQRYSRKPSILDTRPNGNAIARTANFTAFEISSEIDSNGFIAAIYRNKGELRYGMTPVATCMVRNILDDRMANLERTLTRVDLRTG